MQLRSYTLLVTKHIIVNYLYQNSFINPIRQCLINVIFIYYLFLKNLGDVLCNQNAQNAALKIFQKKDLGKMDLERSKNTDAMNVKNGLSKMKDLTE